MMTMKPQWTLQAPFATMMAMKPQYVDVACASARGSARRSSRLAPAS